MKRMFEHIRYNSHIWYNVHILMEKMGTRAIPITLNVVSSHRRLWFWYMLSCVEQRYEKVTAQLLLHFHNSAQSTHSNMLTPAPTSILNTHTSCLARTHSAVHRDEIDWIKDKFEELRRREIEREREKGRNRLGKKPLQRFMCIRNVYKYIYLFKFHFIHTHIWMGFVRNISSNWVPGRGRERKKTVKKTRLIQ